MGSLLVFFDLSSLMSQFAETSLMCWKNCKSPLCCHHIIPSHTSTQPGAESLRCFVNLWWSSNLYRMYSSRVSRSSWSPLSQEWLFKVRRAWLSVLESETVPLVPSTKGPKFPVTFTASFDSIKAHRSLVFRQVGATLGSGHTGTVKIDVQRSGEETQESLEDFPAKATADRLDRCLVILCE